MTASMPIVSAGSTSTTVLPDLLEPQLCTLVERPPGSADWLHELKYDGWRLLARKDGDNVRLYTRGGVEWSQRLPRLVDAVRQLTVTSAWLDGEIVHLDDAGFPDFERLQHDMRVGDERRLIFQTFDLLWINGSDVTRRPLLERKARLREVIGGSDPRIRFTEQSSAMERTYLRTPTRSMLKESSRSAPTASITRAFVHGSGRRQSAGGRTRSLSVACSSTATGISRVYSSGCQWKAAFSLKAAWSSVLLGFGTWGNGWSSWRQQTRRFSVTGKSAIAGSGSGPIRRSRFGHCRVGLVDCCDTPRS